MKAPRLQPFKRYFPISLTWARLAAAPLFLVIFLTHGQAPLAAILLISFAFLSDIFDGILARRWGVATPFLRRLDSFADLCFYLALLICAGLFYREALRPHVPGFAAILLMELGLYGISYSRFGKAPANHAWPSKFWGIVLFASSLALFGFNKPEPWLTATVWVGLIAQANGVLTILLLKKWRQDIRWAWEAVQ